MIAQAVKKNIFSSLSFTIETPTKKAVTTAHRDLLYDFFVLFAVTLLFIGKNKIIIF